MGYRNVPSPVIREAAGVVAIAAVLLTACGSVVVDRSPSATPPYDGPLDAGAAIGALECDGKTPYPPDGYAVEREGDGRVLFSYDVDGRTKVSMFATDGIRDWNGDEG
jgi:hypothetical protein